MSLKGPKAYTNTYEFVRAASPRQPVGNFTAAFLATNTQETTLFTYDLINEYSSGFTALLGPEAGGQINPSVVGYYSVGFGTIVTLSMFVDTGNDVTVRFKAQWRTTGAGYPDWRTVQTDTMLNNTMTIIRYPVVPATAVQVTVQGVGGQAVLNWTAQITDY